MSLAGMNYYLSRKGGLFFFLSSRNLLNWMSDEAYLKRAFRYSLGYELDLEHPKSLNEKLQWLKFHYRVSLYSQLVDNYAVKNWVIEKLGPEYVIPVVAGPWDNVEEIDFDALPEQFVLKCTHDSGGLVICKDKAKFNCGEAKRKLAKSLHRNYYWPAREWPYKDVKPRVFAEKYLDNGHGDFPDYKFFVFDGEVGFLFITTGRNTPSGAKCDYFDPDFHHLPIEIGHEKADVCPEKPVRFEEMKELAAFLGKGFRHVRVDLFEADGQIYFGEITFFHWGGLAAINPPEWDEKLGEWIKLPENPLDN